MQEQYIFIRESYSNQKTVKIGFFYFWLRKNKRILLQIVKDNQVLISVKGLDVGSDIRTNVRCCCIEYPTFFFLAAVAAASPFLL